MSRVLQSSLRRTVKYGSIVTGASLLIAYKYRQAQPIPSKNSASIRVQLPAPVQQGVNSYTMAVPEDLEPWQATFAVPMHCQSCIDEIASTLGRVSGITSLQFSLADQTISIESTVPPSMIQRALASINRDAILRGSGLPDSAAVAILETYAPNLPQGISAVRGLVRMVQVREGLVLFDVGVSNLNEHSPKSGDKASAEGIWAATIRQTGDLSQGPISTGKVWAEPGPAASNGVAADAYERKKGFLGIVEVDATGKGATVLFKEGLPIWELIGRGLVLEKLDLPPTLDSDDPIPNKIPGDEAVVGVIARSAGVWDNDKTVCSCSGKTVWEEREEQRGRGML